LDGEIIEKLQGKENEASWEEVIRYIIDDILITNAYPDE